VGWPFVLYPPRASGTTGGITVSEEVKNVDVTFTLPPEDAHHAPPKRFIPTLWKRLKVLYIAAST
jgi:hypothetical protein